MRKRLPRRRKRRTRKRKKNEVELMFGMKKWSEFCFYNYLGLNF